MNKDANTRTGDDVKNAVLDFVRADAKVRDAITDLLGNPEDSDFIPEMSELITLVGRSEKIMYGDNPSDQKEIINDLSACCVRVAGLLDTIAKGFRNSFRLDLGFEVEYDDFTEAYILAAHGSRTAGVFANKGIAGLLLMHLRTLESLLMRAYRFGWVDGGEGNFADYGFDPDEVHPPLAHSITKCACLRSLCEFMQQEAKPMY